MDELTQYRNKIDQIDNQILELLRSRKEVVLKVGEYKVKNNLPIFHPDREKEIINAKRNKATEYNLEPEFVENLFKQIIQYFRNIQG